MLYIVARSQWHASNLLLVQVVLSYVLKLTFFELYFNFNQNFSFSGEYVSIYI